MSRNLLVVVDIGAAEDTAGDTADSRTDRKLAEVGEQILEEPKSNYIKI
jgi:hypothetical protein